MLFENSFANDAKIADKLSQRPAVGKNAAYISGFDVFQKPVPTGRVQDFAQVRPEIFDFDPGMVDLVQDF